MNYKYITCLRKMKGACQNHVSFEVSGCRNSLVIRWEQTRQDDLYILHKGFYGNLTTSSPHLKMDAGKLYPYWFCSSNKDSELLLPQIILSLLSFQKIVIILLSKAVSSASKHWIYSFCLFFFLKKLRWSHANLQTTKLNGWNREAEQYQILYVAWWKIQ